MEERLQKLLSAAGVCSRRTAEGYIEAGRVTVNGETAQLGTKADPDRDDIRLDGRSLPNRARPVYLLKGRKTVADLVRDCGIRVYPVGRLDLDSEGLLLLTNDGELARRLTHPSGEVEKTYHVWVRGPVTGAAERLAKVRDLEGESIRPARVETLRQGEGRAALAVVIHQGKNRQVRRMCAVCGLEVERLRRVREHTLELGNLPPGKWRYLTAAEVKALQSGSR